MNTKGRPPKVARAKGRARKVIERIWWRGKLVWTAH